jgi:integrase
MEVGQVRSRVRNGKTQYWVEVWWGNPETRYTFSQIPIPGPRGIEWKSCSESEEMTKFLLSIIRGRVKDKMFFPDEFRKQSPMQFDIYARKWLEIKKPNVGSGHYHVMEWAIEKHLIPSLENTYLPSISKNRLREVQNNLISSRRKGDPLSPKGKRNVMDTLLWMLNDACPEYVSRVPDFPGFKGNEAIIPRDIRVPEIETISKVIFNIPDPHRWLFWFMLYTGCRPSEARAFRKSDIEKDRLIFAKTFDRDDKLVPVKGKVAKPGLRTDAVNHILSSAPKIKTPLPYVFINPDTRDHYTMNEVAILWRAACKGSGSGYLKLYDCTRHAYATLMREGGINLSDIKDLMRHVNMKTTEIYDHSSITRLTPAVNKILPFPVGNSVGSLLANDRDSDKSKKSKKK